MNQNFVKLYMKVMEFRLLRNQENMNMVIYCYKSYCYFKWICGDICNVWGLNLEV